MAYCRSCKRHVDDTAKTCPFCGHVMETAVTKDKAVAPRAPQPASVPAYRSENPHIVGSIVWCIVGFLFPIIGILAGVIWLAKSKLCSITTLIGAIGGFLFNLVFLGRILLWYNAVILLVLSFVGIVPNVEAGASFLSDLMSTPILSFIGL